MQHTTYILLGVSNQCTAYDICMRSHLGDYVPNTIHSHVDKLLIESTGPQNTVYNYIPYYKSTKCTIAISKVLKTVSYNFVCYTCT